MMNKKIVMTAEAEGLTPVRAQMRELLSQAGLDEKKSGEVVLALDEVLTNVIRHGYGGEKQSIEIDFCDHADRIEISVRDQGKKFDPTKAAPPKLPPEKAGGLGIYLTKSLMDRVDYDQAWTAGNRLILTKYKNHKPDSR